VKVVIDTNVFVSAIYWPKEERRCFALFAKRKFQLAATAEILEEYAEVARRMHAKYAWADPEPWINWLSLKAGLCESSPLGKQRSHDSTDDIFLGCALASGAAVIVSKDKDLLGLGKPFGVEVLTPRQFLGWAKCEGWR